MTYSYAFPLIARFENSTKEVLGNAFRLVFLNFKNSITLLLIDVMVIVLAMASKVTDTLLLMIGFAGLAYVRSLVLIQVFQPYEKETAKPVS